MSLEIWTVSGAPSPWRAALGMAFKGLDYDVHLLSAAQKEHKSEAYLVINPRGTVPTVKEGDTTLSQSIAILAWLDRKYPDAPLFGGTPHDAALIWQRTMEIFDYLPDATSGVLSPIFFQGADQATDDLKAASERLQSELARLTGILADTLFLSGERPGAADAVAFPHVRLIQRAMETNPTIMQALGLTDLATVSPEITDWVGRIEALPNVAATFPPHWA
ncbi:glutathione S-transferase family protein [Cognatiyoonia sp. IB215182]|uniref:glutathione S-transferase family protein n=1 Tax=Cognatiyoonia sp. IB215182 TaxID=3097353 RepID=UPI002A0D92AA|nr:glutathione S-transferase family protein [Cognatiyoonia sp. IB215182]MDX8354725.1 glutathione S-transferase family protein [Cognatiyoonia sp. IB215182]